MIDNVSESQKCSGLNSPRRPERASDQRVRLAHPYSQTQLSNSFILFSRRVSDSL